MWLLMTMGCGQSQNVKKENNNSASNNNLHQQDHVDGSDEYKKEKLQQNSINDTQVDADNNKHNKSDSFKEFNHSYKDNNSQSKNKGSSQEAGPPIQSGLHVTESQVEFFRILDEKIEQGVSKTGIITTHS